MHGGTRLAGLVGALLGLVALAGPGQAAAPESGEIKIGVSVSATGGFSAEAPHYVNDVRLAEKQINQAGGINGKKLNVMIFDNQSTNPAALSALNKAVEQDKVLAYIGGNQEHPDPGHVRRHQGVRRPHAWSVAPMPRSRSRATRGCSAAA